jgi:hypothetical protein
MPEASAATDRKIEERLERLERLVDSLVAQQNPRRGRMDVRIKDKNKDRDTEGDEVLANPKDAAEFKAEMKRNLERSMGQFKQEGLQMQLKTLEREREALQREMEKLQRQIEKIQREHEKLEGADEKKENRP